MGGRTEVDRPTRSGGLGRSQVTPGLPCPPDPQLREIKVHITHLESRGFTPSQTGGDEDRAQVPRSPLRQGVAHHGPLLDSEDLHDLVLVHVPPADPMPGERVGVEAQLTRDRTGLDQEAPSGDRTEWHGLIGVGETADRTQQPGVASLLAPTDPEADLVGRELRYRTVRYVLEVSQQVPLVPPAVVRPDAGERLGM